MIYTALAPIYDRIMAHVSYDEWAGLITGVLARYSGAGDPTILEFGAGTAVLGQRLRERGLRHTVSDLSPAMCKEAARRGCLPFCADARFPPVKVAFDMVLFLYDGINYFMGLDDYALFFMAIHTCLREKGLLLFDVTTTANSMRYFRNFLDYNDFGHCAYLRSSSYSSLDRTQHNDFMIFTRVSEHSRLFERHDEHHIQRVFSIPEISETVPRDLFEIIGKWDGFSFRKYSSRSERVHFLLRKKGRP